MNFKFKNNLKKNFSGSVLMRDLAVALAAAWYVYVPSLFKLQGWMGFLVGLLPPYLIGKAIDEPAISYGVVATGATHLFYIYGQDISKAISGQNIWSFGANNTADKTKPETPKEFSEAKMEGLSGASFRRLPSGEEVMVYDGNSGINDYLMPGDFGGMNDYQGGSEIPKLAYAERF